MIAVIITLELITPPDTNTPQTCNIRHVECANTVFMIVRSCRLLLWGCSPRFVLAKMLLEHIAAEESKRLFADDKEQAAHLMTLKSAADQASSNVSDVPTADIPAYSSSVNTIFSPFDQLDKYGIIHSSSQESEGMPDLAPFEGQQMVGTSSKRYHTETSDRHALRPDASLVCAGAKKKKAAVSSSSIKAARIAAEGKMRPSQLSSASTSNILAVVNSQNQNQNQHQQLLQYNNQRPMFLGNQNQSSYDTNGSEGRVDFNYEGLPNLRQPPIPFQAVNSHLFQPQSSGHSFSFPPRSLYEKQMMTMNRCSSSSSTSLHTMNGGGSSWTTDGSALDSISHYHIPASTAASMSSSYSVSSGLSSNNSNSNLALSDMQLDMSTMQHSDLLSCKVSSMHVDLHQHQNQNQNQNQRHWQQQQWLHQQRQQFQQQQQQQQPQQQQSQR
jgi:hypothetical protein